MSEKQKHNEEVPSNAQIASMLYPALKGKNITVAQIKDVMRFITGSKELRDAYQEAKESGSLIPVAETAGIIKDATLEQVLETMSDMHEDTDSDEFYVSQITQFILEKACEGVDHLVESKTANEENVDLETWISELDDSYSYHEELKEKNPNFYQKGKRKAMQILVATAMAAELDIGEELPKTLAVNGYLEGQPQEILELVTDKALADTRFDLLGKVAAKYGVELSDNERVRLIEDIRKNVKKQLEK